jgi:hypothetical protein
MTRIIGHKWTPHDDHLLITAWEGGATALVIAASFTERGIPMMRSAILGRINRLRKAGVAISERTPQRNKPKATKPERKSKRPVVEVPRFKARVEPPPAPPKSKVSGRLLMLWDRWPDGACRWPVYDGVVTHTHPIFCGQPVAETGCYCTEHALRARPIQQPPTTSRAGTESSPRARGSF